MIWVFCILSILLAHLNLGFFVGHIVRKRFCEFVLLDADLLAVLRFIFLLNLAWPKSKLLTCCAMTTGMIPHWRDDVENLVTTPPIHIQFCDIGSQPDCLRIDEVQLDTT